MRAQPYAKGCLSNMRAIILHEAAHTTERQLKADDEMESHSALVINSCARRRLAARRTAQLRRLAWWRGWRRFVGLPLLLLLGVLLLASLARSVGAGVPAWTSSHAPPPPQPVPARPKSRGSSVMKHAPSHAARGPKIDKGRRSRRTVR
jgi:hypothetical protein